RLLFLLPRRAPLSPDAFEDPPRVRGPRAAAFGLGAQALQQRLPQRLGGGGAGGERPRVKLDRARAGGTRAAVAGLEGRRVDELCPRSHRRPVAAAGRALVHREAVVVAALGEQVAAVLHQIRRRTGVEARILVRHRARRATRRLLLARRLLLLWLL